MAIAAKTNETKPDVNAPFYEKMERTLKEVFEKAKANNELHFAMALMPEMRGMQDGGWNTAEEASDAYSQFCALLDKLAADDIVRVRVLLALYLHTAECSGFYEVPKKMLLTSEGKGNNYLPFQKLVKKNRKTGQAIAPNANAIMKDLMGHSWLLGFRELSEVFEEAFDADVRNAIAHADYTIAKDGFRLRRRNGGHVRVVPWEEFGPLMDKGINLFSTIRRIGAEYVHSYNPPKTIKAQMSEREPLTDYTIHYDPETQMFGFTTGTQQAKANSPPAARK
jgi:hypothetical protein